MLTASREQFVKSALIPEEFSRSYGAALNARETVDYDIGHVMDEEQAHDILTSARRFMAEVTTYLERLGYT